MTSEEVLENTGTLRPKCSSSFLPTHHLRMRSPSPTEYPTASTDQQTSNRSLVEFYYLGRG